MYSVAFLAFDFCRFCVVIQFFHPRHNGQCRMDFLSQILSITFHCLSEFLRKSQYFPFWMFSAKQGNYWYHFYNVLDWGLDPGPPALEASTLPLGYWGGGPWLGIEPGTSRTRSQHYTTRLSRRRFSLCIVKPLLCILSVFYLTALLFNIYQKDLNADQLTLLRIHVVLVL